MNTEFIKSLRFSTDKAYRSSGFAPLIWITGIIIVPLTIGYINTHNDLFIIIIICWLSIILLVYIVLMFVDRSELHSEFYLLENKKLDLIARQGESPHTVNPSDNVDPRLPEGDSK